MVSGKSQMSELLSMLGNYLLCFIKEYQTLIAGGMALFAAWKTVSKITVQIEQSDKQHKDLNRQEA